MGNLTAADVNCPSSQISRSAQSAEQNTSKSRLAPTLFLYQLKGEMNVKVHLYKVSGYEEAIMSLRMSKGKHYSLEKAKEIQELVYVCTDQIGGRNSSVEYTIKLRSIDYSSNKKITGDYHTDMSEFERLLGLTFDNAMGKFNHHTLMKYIDISFFTEGLHRGAQDDLDAHAIAFNNRITRFSTRLAEIDEPKLSEWYRDKIIPFHDAHHIIFAQGVQHCASEFADHDEKELAHLISENEGGHFHEGTTMPEEIIIESHYRKEKLVFKYTAFGYVLENFADMSKKSGLYKDVVRGGMPIGMESDALWKSDMFNLRYVYHMRSKLTKANPELRDAMEMLADQIEETIPVFGPYFRKVLTDTGHWEHTNRTRTVTKEEYELLKKLREE